MLCIVAEKNNNTKCYVGYPYAILLMYQYGIWVSFQQRLQSVATYLKREGGKETDGTTDKQMDRLIDGDRLRNIMTEGERQQNFMNCIYRLSYISNRRLLMHMAIKPKDNGLSWNNILLT